MLFGSLRRNDLSSMLVVLNKQCSFTRYDRLRHLSLSDLLLAPLKIGLKSGNRGESAIHHNHQKSFKRFLNSSLPLAILDFTVPILISRAVAISS